MRAVTRRLHDPVDLNDVARGDGYLFVRDAVGHAGRGVACRVPIDDAASLLASIDHEVIDELPADGRGTYSVGGDTIASMATISVGPIAFAAVPFVPGSPADAVVPAVCVHKGRDGAAWITTIDDADAALTAPPPHAATASYHLGPVAPVEQYLDAVTGARDAVRAGRLTKAVIARPIEVHADRPIDVHAVLLRLRASFGSSYRYSIDGFIGASPELLVSIDDGTMRSHPLAGTAPRTGDPANDSRIAIQLIESTKDQVEHRVVVEVVHDTLLPYCSYLDWQPEPSIVTVANVQHLGSEVEGRLSSPPPPIVELVRALSPTPALGGHPRNDALALIAQLEGFERGRYGGAVGWLDARGQGTFAVAIRGAELSDDRCSARLVAGGGIVADSDPLAELAETQAKFQAMLSAIVRP